MQRRLLSSLIYSWLPEHKYIMIPLSWAVDQSFATWPDRENRKTEREREREEEMERRKLFHFYVIVIYWKAFPFWVHP